MQYAVKNRHSGETQFTAEIDCTPDTAPSMQMGLAVKWASANRASLRSANLGGANLRSANLRDADLGGANLGGANLRSANLRDADLRSANLRDADLRGANLGDADLRGANLGDADLRDADLRGANLGDADLRSANLRDADLGNQWIIQGATRSDGHFFMLTCFKGEGVRVKAGCRNFTLAQAQAHWESTRANTPLGAETFAILLCLEALAKARGYNLNATGE